MSLMRSCPEQRTGNPGALQKLPKAANAERVQFCVSTQDRDVHLKRVGSYHAIEWIALVSNEPPGAESVFSVDRQQRISGVLNNFEEISLKSDCPRKFAETYLRGNLPRSSRRYEDHVERIGHYFRYLTAQGFRGNFCPKQSVGVE
jgi:hypothetical protein